jgi:hypothetical protein
LSLAERTRQLTTLIPERWPYAPLTARLRVVPASTYQGDWGGWWSFQTNTAYINADLDPISERGVCAHELAHARWSNPRTVLRGEEGSTMLAVELFDELRVEHFAVNTSPLARDDTYAWLATIHDTIHIPNHRGAALAYGYLHGHHLTGVFTTNEVADVRSFFTDRMGDDWCTTLDRFITAALQVPPGENGTLTVLARSWDRYATQTVV